MCGIALVLSGVSIRRPDADGDSPPLVPGRGEDKEASPSIVDIESCLRRRGPDNFGCRKFILKHGSCGNCAIDGDLCHLDPEFLFEASDWNEFDSYGSECSVDISFLGATLQLRGASTISQPLVDTSGNLLVYNGEVFSGMNVDIDKNDGEAILEALRSCCSCYSLGKYCNCTPKMGSLVDILSTIRGPWSLIYWQARSKTIWFGKDAFGRRSLLVHWPTLVDPRLILSSVSSSSSASYDSSTTTSKKDMKTLKSNLYWEELPCGIYSLCFGCAKSSVDKRAIVGEVRRHEWTSPLLRKLSHWDRTFVNPTFDSNDGSIPSQLSDCSTSLQADKLITDACELAGHSPSAHKLLVALRESVMCRTILPSNFKDMQGGQQREAAPIAVLFSGGLDSMILAALLDNCLDQIYPIDLLNVSFDGMHAPDRISAREGVRELQIVSPKRRWRLVEIDAELSKLTWETKHIMSLIDPAKTYMDLNIGIALWLAACGEGFVDGNIANPCQEGFRYKYFSKARILLVGSGADEQCAGYGRHRTKYKIGSWTALQEEMKLDMQRIWKRNLGRDDRCLSDHGKEARFPFLDESVIEILLEMPLWEVANLNEPVGFGDKKILREVAKLLGLNGASALPKRAIQFGSRIARESNKQNFGSNRAANQASAGSVVVGLERESRSHC